MKKVIKENKSDKIISLRAQGIWAMTSIAIIGMIGGFWGSEGFKWIGVCIIGLSALSVFILSSKGIIE